MDEAPVKAASPGALARNATLRKEARKMQTSSESGKSEVVGRGKPLFHFFVFVFVCFLFFCFWCFVYFWFFFFFFPLLVFKRNLSLLDIFSLFPEGLKQIDALRRENTLAPSTRNTEAWCSCCAREKAGPTEESFGVATFASATAVKGQQLQAIQLTVGSWPI